MPSKQHYGRDPPGALLLDWIARSRLAVDEPEEAALPYEAVAVGGSYLATA